MQKTVNRNYTQGFAGEIVRDGPKRAKPGRINSATVGADPGASTNRISRAFGYSADLPATGTTQSAEGALVIVGGPVFFGILGNPKHYALYGGLSAANGPGSALTPSYDLPIGANAEFFDMATGLCVEIFNFTTGAVTSNFGDNLAYVPSNISTANNPLALPYGALVSYAAGSAVPTGLVAIPNARVINTAPLAASGVGALVSTDTIVQLTQ